MGTFPQRKICHTSNKSDVYLRICADFFWNFGLKGALPPQGNSLG
jgi:hypothetical protein